MVKKAHTHEDEGYFHSKQQEPQNQGSQVGNFIVT